MTEIEPDAMSRSTFAVIDSIADRQTSQILPYQGRTRQCPPDSCMAPLPCEHWPAIIPLVVRASARIARPVERASARSPKTRLLTGHSHDIRVSSAFPGNHALIVELRKGMDRCDFNRPAAIFFRPDINFQMPIVFTA